VSAKPVIAAGATPSPAPFCGRRSRLRHRPRIRAITYSKRAFPGVDDPRRYCDSLSTMGSPLRSVLVWDISVRVFHWFIVALVAAAYATWRLNWMVWHQWIGYATLTLVLFRLSWGFFGSETARFSSFLASPRNVSQHLKDSLRREPDRRAGHNPAGGWMVVILIALLLAETLTGIYVANDIVDEGPLTEHVSARAANAIAASHAIFWDALLVAIALHVLAIAGFAAIKGQNLLRPMITGMKALPANVTAPPTGSPARAGLLLLGCAVAAAVLVIFL
jgi:cytochrome b